MAHTCPNCGLICHCGGDIDDIVIGNCPPRRYCTHCDLEDEDDDWEDFGDDEDIDVDHDSRYL
jgi:hypothetical protein